MIRHPVLDQLAQHGVKMGLEQVRSLLTHMGEPQAVYPSVHIAGTNGKGSTCMMVTSALVAAGYRVGTNLSPHLEQVNERIRIDSQPLDDVTLRASIESLDRVRHDWRRSLGDNRPPLTYFEFMTVLAMREFAAQGVHVGVFETGMGGRLDATNVLRPVVTAITTIGLDHQEQLGGTVDRIAGEKAGILKKGVPLILGLVPEEAREVVLARARMLGCEVWRPGPQLRRELRKGRWSFSTPEGQIVGVDLPLEGLHMGHNAMLAVGILHQLRRMGFLVPDEAIVHGLESVDFGGRLEQLADGLIVDGAHNVDGARALATWLGSRERPERRVLLFGMGAGRDPMPIIAELHDHFDEIVTTRCAHPKAMDAMDLAMMLQDRVEIPLAAGRDIDQDLAELYQEADETIVAGSLFLAGAARSLVRAGALEGLTPGSVDVPDDEDLEDEDDG